MRQRRIKVAPEEERAVYHCMSRTVNGERLFDDVAREVLRKQFWQVAEYCGLQIITHAILSNHFHVLVRVPLKVTPSDSELLRRYRTLYPTPTAHQNARLEVISQQLATNGPEAVLWRRQQLALMGDVSPFMKLVKQRFSIWFNRSRQRYGTLWSERFKSVLVEPDGRALRTIAAYIDLNGVRAGLVHDPKDDRFCGYAAALAGHLRAQAGLCSIHDNLPWAEVQAGYRQVLFGTGSGTRQQGGIIAPEKFQQVLRSEGTLPLASVLRCRLRFFTDGAILGSRVFVALQLAAHRRRTGRQGMPPAPPLPLAHWGDLTVLRKPRRHAVG